MSLRSVVSRLDSSISARIVRRVPLAYADTVDAALDRPRHVRAASGLAWDGDRLVALQDDANFLALADPRSGEARTIVMPAGKGGRRQFDSRIGNKQDKFDFEALTRVRTPSGDRLLAFGSGSSPDREHMAVIDLEHDDVRIVHAGEFYAALRAETRFSGSDMNIEGAVTAGSRLRLFARGNGTPKDGRSPVDATCDIDLALLLRHLVDGATEFPRPIDVVQYELDSIAGVRLGFTDAAIAPDAGSLADCYYLASAEQSPDAITDGAVAGSVIGILTEENGARAARWTPILDERGHRLAAKAEGLAFDAERAGTAYIVLDTDAHDAPSELCEVRLAGF